jgi:hypothetical protein
MCRIPPPSISFFLFAFLFLIVTDSKSQCKPTSCAFEDGEKITYLINYNWGPIWIKAGKVVFETNVEDYQGKPSWHIVSTGRTVTSIEFLFKVRDTYQSWVDTNTYKTLEFQRYIYENGFQLQNTSWFNYRQGIVLSNTKRNDDPLITDTLEMKPCTFDMLSACFYVRSLDMDTLIQDSAYPVNMAIDDNVYTVWVKLAGEEIVEIDNGDRYECLKFAATMVEGTVFEKDQEAYIYVTKDPNHIPVYIEAKIIVGYVKGFLRKAKGLKYPLTSKVD